MALATNVRRKLKRDFPNLKMDKDDIELTNLTMEDCRVLLQAVQRSGVDRKKVIDFGISTRMREKGGHLMKYGYISGKFFQVYVYKTKKGFFRSRMTRRPGD